MNCFDMVEKAYEIGMMQIEPEIRSLTAGRRSPAAQCAGDR